MNNLLKDPPYIIAEAGGNHGGSVEKAKEYVQSAAQTGADAIKFQLFQAEKLLEPDLPLLPGAGTDHNNQFERYKELELSIKEWNEIVDMCDELDIDFAASVFDRSMADFASEKSPFIKIASGDLTNIPLIRHIAKKNLPLILSTGYSTWDEIENITIELAEKQFALLHCIGSYPTQPTDANLQIIRDIDEQFDCPVGYSDHTVGTTAAKAAVANGAKIVEKHFTLNKKSDVGDHSLSATPSQMNNIVKECKKIESMFSDKRRDGPFGPEEDRKTRMRRSLATNEFIRQGDKFTSEKLTALRPERGVSPTKLDEVVGRKASRDIDPLTILTKDDVSPNHKPI